MQLGSRAWSLGKLFLLVAGLVATFFVFAGIAMRVAIRARELTVPNLIGRPLEAAESFATQQGLTLRVDETRRPDDKVPAGHVPGVPVVNENAADVAPLPQ